MEKLKLGVAYHGNRLLRHVKEDMKDIVEHNMNLVVHMYTHNDMDRHKNVMKEIFDVTKDYGLENWVDNWGIAGTPGDKCHFLGYHPESHIIYSDGSVDPVNVCYNSAPFVDFTKQWIEYVKEAGGDKLFWDEPHLRADENGIYGCCCPTCQKLFRERFGYDMPKTYNDDARAFQAWTVGNYFKQITEYSHSLGMENITCLMPISLQLLSGVIDLPYLDDIGTDPYWIDRCDNPYEYVYNGSKEFMDQVREHGKKTHIWIQTYHNHSGKEDEIYLAADAAYDAGARNIIAWSYRGGEACDYKADNCDMVWNVTGDAMRRLRDRYQDEVRAQYRMKMQSKK